MYILSRVLRNYPPVSKHLVKTMSECLTSLSGNVENALKRPCQTSCVEVPDEKRQHLDSKKIKRKKFAVLICYSGQGYLGLQRNPGMKTIEEDFLSAMLKAGIINDEAYSQPKLLEFQRAARTDKGVSAVRQVLSLKLPEDLSIEKINENLPAQIRMVAVRKATKGFNCKGNCDARTYSYMMPTFSLAPKDDPISESFRVPHCTIEKLNKVLQLFIGTHNYHNFTSRKKSLDPSANRYIISFNCGEPYLVEDMEFVTLKVKGQSFMLHQIRKMVGLTIAIIRGLTTEETITRSYGDERLDIPIAPGVGLVLEEVHYDRYNQRFGNDGMHEPLEWSDVENVLEEFRKQFILPTIKKAEEEEKSMLNWLQSLPLHSFDVRHGDKKQNVPEEESHENENQLNGEHQEEIPDNSNSKGV